MVKEGVGNDLRELKESKVQLNIFLAKIKNKIIFLVAREIRVKEESRDSGFSCRVTVVPFTKRGNKEESQSEEEEVDLVLDV